MRTTVDIDPVVLDVLRARQAAEGRTLGSLVSELLARALAESDPASEWESTVDFAWTTAALRPRVDLADKDAVADLLDQS